MRGGRRAHAQETITSPHTNLENTSLADATVVRPPWLVGFTATTILLILVLTARIHIQIWYTNR